MFRKIIQKVKLIRVLILYKVFKGFMFFSRKNIKVLNFEETVKIIRDNHLSVSRFGDGEFRWISQSRESDSFEKNSAELAAALSHTLTQAGENPNLLISIPNVFESTMQFDFEHRKFWAYIVGTSGYKWLPLLSSDYNYGDSLFSRPYLGYVNDDSESKFTEIKTIWANRSVILVEGELTRFGLGNDLLEDVKQLRRIICPSINAFESINKIYDACLAEAESESEKPLFLIALGPTATVLAERLSVVGLQAIDIGHLDIEYEWYLTSRRIQSTVSFKYVNETKEKIKTTDIPEPLRSVYNNQVIRRVDC